MTKAMSKTSKLTPPTATKATLVLEDGTRYEGTSFGAPVSALGEAVFNTGMMGYPETLTDPSYEGQIINFTSPLIGNYGVPDDGKEQGLENHFESNRIHPAGIIVSEYSEVYSHWEAVRSLGQWLKDNNIPAITGVDTRAITQHLRTNGAMLGKVVIGNDSKMLSAKFHDPNKDNLVAQVCVKEPITYKTTKAKGKAKTILLLDCGIKNNSIRSFLDRGANVIRVPWNYDFIAKGVKCDGLFLSNGPGDPMLIKETHAIVKKALAAKLPTFGICLGNQLMSIAAGAKTYKLKFGHRSQNQPCMDMETKRCYITSQNHGFAVDPKTLPKKGWSVWFENVNDGTVEGVKHRTLPFFAVQFHPESTPGPLDTGFLFDKFMKVL